MKQADACLIGYEAYRELKPVEPPSWAVDRLLPGLTDRRNKRRPQIRSRLCRRFGRELVVVLALFDAFLELAGVVGTCTSLGVTIESNDPREFKKRIEEGEYDDEFAAEASA